MLDRPATPLIELFNQTFIPLRQTELVCCEDEPIYRPATADYPHHRIIFAHGFFASALHEIAHWCIAGSERRQLEDFGYWYQPDGRDSAQQAVFESVEIKPQALEWIFSVASRHPFHFSADNLEGRAGVSEAFQQKVWAQTQTYLTEGAPQDAERWIKVLCQHFRPEAPIRLEEFQLS